MTPEEMRRLPAGRELDCEVARRVFGETDEIERLSPTGELFIRRPNGWEPLPRYSAVMNAAWRVIEHLRSLGWMVELAGDATWHCTFEGHESRLPADASADAAPLAICIAALLAVAA